MRKLKPTLMEESKKQIMETCGDCAFLLKRLAKFHSQTYAHSMRVGFYSYLLGKTMNFSEAQNLVLLKSAFLHDIGKIAIPARLLNQTGPLTDEEWGLIQSHCKHGLEMTTHCVPDGVDPNIIMYHHENLDGSGYHGLSGDEIALPVRILRVVDSFDAMTNPRDYKRPRSFDEAFRELFRWSGTVYDPQVVHSFYKMFSPHDDLPNNVSL